MKQQDKFGIYAIGIVVLLGIGYLFAHKAAPTSITTPSTSDVTSPAKTTGASSTNTLPGLQTGSLPWNTSIQYLKDRLTAINLPALSQEGTALHIHQHLDITINKETVVIPAGIGINETARFISPIHVHDTTGIVHVESPTIQTFTLGQFFDIWGVQLTPTCIGGYCASETENLHFYINGKLYQGNPRDIELAAHQEIYIFYGLANDLPSTIPSTYQFPEGY